MYSHSCIKWRNYTNAGGPHKITSNKTPCSSYSRLANQITCIYHRSRKMQSIIEVVWPHVSRASTPFDVARLSWTNKHTRTRALQEPDTVQQFTATARLWRTQQTRTRWRRIWFILRVFSHLRHRLLSPLRHLVHHVRYVDDELLVFQHRDRQWSRLERRRD